MHATLVSYYSVTIGVVMSSLSLLLRMMGTVRNWPTYLRRRFGQISEDRTVYKLKSGMSLGVRTHSSDTNVFNDVWLMGVYDNEGLDWKNIRTVVDVGAHIGVFVLYALDQAPSAKIYAFEPEPQNLAVLKENIERNGAGEKIIVEPSGIASEAGKLRLNVMPGRGECNSLFRQTEESYSLEVPVTTLPLMFAKYGIQKCDLLKMNCEGAEYDIFYTLPDELFQSISAMLINYHFYSSNPKHHPKVLQSHLESKGFTVTKNAKDIFFAKRL